MDFRICPRIRNNHLLLEQPQLSIPNVGNNVPEARVLIIGIAAAAGVLATICLSLIYLAKCLLLREDDSDNPNIPNTCSSHSSDCNSPTFTIVVYNTSIQPPFLPSSSSLPPSGVEASSSFEQTTCSICLDEFKDGEKISVLPKCKHSFHQECIEGWIPSKSFLCPVCRDKVVGKKDESSGPDCNQEVVVGLSQPYFTGFGQNPSHL